MMSDVVMLACMLTASLVPLAGHMGLPEAVSSIVYFGPACLRPAFLAGSFYPAHFDPAKKAGLNKYIQVKKW